MLADQGERAVAVELRLPHPVGAVENLVAQLRVHWRELVGERPLVAGSRQQRRRQALHRDRGQLLDRYAGEHRSVLRGEVRLGREAVLMLDQEPVLGVLGAHQREGSLDLLAAQQDAELSLLHSVADALLGLSPVVKPVFLVLVWRIDAAIPDDDLACAVLPRGNHAFERAIVERVVFGSDREALLRRVERRPLRHCP